MWFSGASGAASESDCGDCGDMVTVVVVTVMTAAMTKFTGKAKLFCCIFLVDSVSVCLGCGMVEGHNVCVRA